MARNFSVSANSCAPASTMDGSDQTAERGPTLRDSSSPTTMATRYVGMHVFCSKKNVRVPSAFSTVLSSRPMALISAVRALGTVTLAVYVILAAGASCEGASERKWMAWHWEKRYGCFLPAVCSGVSHCSAVTDLDVA